MRGTLLVPHQDQLDLRADQRIEYRQRRAPGQPENVLNPGILETLDQCLATRHIALTHYHLLLTRRHPQKPENRFFNKTCRYL